MSPSFADLGVPPSLASALADRGIDAPFPIQAATLPDALAGRDVCGRAPTGSGKTIAFGIPLVVRTGRAQPRRPRALVLVPTRELASQVTDELRSLAGRSGPSVDAFYGGVGFPHQLRALARGVDIAVACPGRLADLINQDELSLADVELVVLDEADRMADMGFLPEVRRLLDRCRDDRQTLLFSATLDGDVDVLISRYQRDPVRHEHEAADDGGRAEHRFWLVGSTDRLATAAAIVDRTGPTVVFCRTKRGADRIARQLEAAGVKAAAIHGDRSQAQREAALDRFHHGQVDALVATDVAARGIHVDGVACVIHYDPPADAKDYVHRSGRTARAGATGLVVTLVLGDKRSAVRGLQRELGLDEPIVAPDLDELAAFRAPRVRPVTVPPRRRRSGSSRPSNDRAARAGGDRGPRRGGDAGDRRPRPSTAGARGPGRPAERAHGAGSGHDDRRTARPDDRGAPAERRPRPAAAARQPRSDDAGRPERAPLAPGQRRPSGAARRKAKRLAALEAPSGTGPLDRRDDRDDDLRDGRSSRPRPPAASRSGAGRGPGRGTGRGGSSPAGRGGDAGRGRPARGGARRGPSASGGPSTRGSGSGSSRSRSRSAAPSSSGRSSSGRRSSR